jgi:4-alpha-glucanotransferase
MQVHFHIHYLTYQGEVLMLSGSAPETGYFQEEKAVEMIHLGDGYWHLWLDLRDAVLLEYRYFIRENAQTKRREWGDNHRVGISFDTDFSTIYDFWQPEPDNRFLYSSAYTDSLLKVDHIGNNTDYTPNKIVLKVQAPFVRKGQCIGISGDAGLLGKWEDGKALKMQSERFPEWNISLDAKNLPESSNYKFVVLDQSTGKNIGWEWGEPRSLFTPRCMDRQMVMHSGMVYRFQEAPWNGSGVAIPVFSLRSEDSWGCGDFDDLKKMTQWAELTGQQLIQILPINDTTLTDTWRDSYPYNAISIFALHPIYASIKALSPLKDKKAMKRYEKMRIELNALPEMDYERVIQLKWEYFTDLFKQEGEIILQSEGYKRFFESNKDWLLPYAAFCYLRKKHDNFDFRLWGEFATYNPKQIQVLSDHAQTWHKDLSIHYYIQYLLHLQLTDARDFAHAHSVILKGDIPIGISRYSVEAWTESSLFNMEAQVGAPPDDFSVTGQNWGFPSYNWQKMEAEDFRWWKHRFGKMADYFDAYRIDHILGFFRIWEIPLHSVEGLLGHFSPALPLSIQEMRDAAFDFDEKMMTEPFITEDLLIETFGESIDEIKKKYLKKISFGRFQLKTGFNAQTKIRDHFEKTKTDYDAILVNQLFSLCNEVLFVKDSQKPELFHPRISAFKTACYNSLLPHQKAAFDKLYNDFFYIRNVSFWKQKAMDKLPALVFSTRMLTCGEDLGMIPSCVPDVMHELGILSLEIQRMPKTFGVLFENLNAIPYQSVCTTSTHDMSPIRAWWTENREITQQFYQQVLWKQGEVPLECTPDIAGQIIRAHLASPALWVILPWQDWMSLDQNLRNPDPNAERINIPANPHHYWRYRMHLSLEKLLNEKAFNDSVLEMVKRSGRI